MGGERGLMREYRESVASARRHPSSGPIEYGGEPRPARWRHELKLRWHVLRPIAKARARRLASRVPLPPWMVFGLFLASMTGLAAGILIDVQGWSLPFATNVASSLAVGPFATMLVLALLEPSRRRVSQGAWEWLHAEVADQLAGSLDSSLTSIGEVIERDSGLHLGFAHDWSSADLFNIIDRYTYRREHAASSLAKLETTEGWNGRLSTEAVDDVRYLLEGLRESIELAASRLSLSPIHAAGVGPSLHWLMSVFGSFDESYTDAERQLQRHMALAARRGEVLETPWPVPGWTAVRHAVVDPATSLLEALDDLVPWSHT